MAKRPSPRARMSAPQGTYRGKPDLPLEEQDPTIFLPGGMARNVGTKGGIQLSKALAQGFSKPAKRVTVNRAAKAAAAEFDKKARRAAAYAEQRLHEMSNLRLTHPRPTYHKPKKPPRP